MKEAINGKVAMDVNSAEYLAPRNCMREPTPEILEVAKCLEMAVDAHLRGERDVADELFRKANSKEARGWIESLWGARKKWPEQTHFLRIRKVSDLSERRTSVPDRMPDPATRRALIDRDGFNCRYCGLPVVPADIREEVHTDYADAVPWGRKNPDQHAAFQAFWLQYDHVIPHTLGGDNNLENLVICCAGCNFAKSNYALEELGLIHPLTRPLVRTDWDGLTRYLAGKRSWKP